MGEATDESGKSRLQHLIDRIAAGDPTARQELVDELAEHICDIARKIFHSRRFQDLRSVTDTASILNAAVVRVLELPTITAPTVGEFLNVVAWVIRNVLVDVARSRKRPGWLPPQGVTDDSTALSGVQRVDDRADPADVAERDELVAILLDGIKDLPVEEQQVVNCRLLGLDRPNSARVLGLHLKKVDRLWASAKLRLSELLPE